MASFLWSRLILLVLLLNVVAGCGYHITNSQPGQRGETRKIWIPFFANESISPTAQTVLRRVFYEEIHALRGLNPADSEENADLAMKARLISYSSSAVSYNALDQAREYSLNVNVELEITKKGQSAPLWKGRIQAAKQYPASTDLALQRNAEEQALEASTRIIAQKFITVLEESY